MWTQLAFTGLGRIICVVLYKRKFDNIVPCAIRQCLFFLLKIQPFAFPMHFIHILLPCQAFLQFSYEIKCFELHPSRLMP